MLKSHIPRVARGAALTLAITAVGCTLSATASAETTIGAFKGVPTLDGLSTSSVYSYDDTAGVTTRTEVIRAGTAVDQTSPAFDLVAGDTIQSFNATTGALLAQVPFDGLPALGASTCVGSASLSGLRNPAGSVDGVMAYKRGALVSNPYGSYRPQEDVIRGSVLTTAGTGYIGVFRKAIPAGDVVRASQSLLLSGTTSYEVSVERLVADCPAPVPAPPVRDVAGPSGQLSLPAFLRKSQLRSKRGMTVKATVSEAAAVKVEVFADNGAKLPGLQAAAAKVNKKAKLVRIAVGRKHTAKAARINVQLRATKLGRAAMRGSKHPKAIVVTTLTDTAGNVARLKPKKITIH